MLVAFQVPNSGFIFEALKRPSHVYLRKSLISSNASLNLHLHIILIDTYHCRLCFHSFTLIYISIRHIWILYLHLLYTDLEGFYISLPPARTLVYFPISCMCATLPAHLFLCAFITIKYLQSSIHNEAFRSVISPPFHVEYYPQHPVFFSVKLYSTFMLTAKISYSLEHQLWLH